MSKKQISISELAQRIVLEKKFNKMVAEITKSMRSKTKTINENLPTGIDQAILGASKKLDAAGEDVADQDVQAAMLLAAIEKGGDPAKITTDDVEKNMPSVQERKQVLKESENVALLITEMISLVLGNAALIEGICKVITKITGKNMDANKFKAGANKVATLIKNITGWPMKAFGKAVAWIIGKLGGGEAAQKIGKYSVKLVVVVTLFVIGVTFFPVAGVSGIGIALSITGLIGKGFEIITLVKELFVAIRDTASKGASSMMAKASANNPAMTGLA